MMAQLPDDPMLTDEQKAHEIGDQLRTIAAFLEEHPQLGAAVYGTGACHASIQVPCRTREELTELARVLARATGRCDKNEMGSYFQVRAEFGCFYLWGAVDRELVCRKVVKGVRHVPATTVPAHEVEDVEWVCEPSLLAAPKAVA